MTRWELIKLVIEVLQGKYGNGREREQRLPNYEAVQEIVNCILKWESKESYETECSKENIKKILAELANEE